MLNTEYSDRFDELRKNRMAMSFYKYGPIKENYGNKYVKAVASLEKRLQMYKETGNTEYLVDVANFAMIEFMYPQHENAHFEATDSDKSPGVVGMPVNEARALAEGD